MSSFEEFINNLSPEQIQVLKEALDKASVSAVKPRTTELPSLSKTNQEEAVSSKSRSIVTDDFKVIRENKSDFNQRKSQVRAKKNEWVDNGEDRDPDFNPEKFERMGRAARNRQRINKKSVECHVCGRSFQVNPNLIYGEFIRCNRCTGR